MLLQKRHLTSALKLLALVLALVFLFARLREEDAISGLGTLWKDGNFSGPLMLLVIVLMPVNWMLEAIKWKLLTSDFQKHSLSAAIKATLVGVFYTMFTPNRIGEGAGRFHYIKKGNRSRATYGFLTGSAAQLLCTLFAGSIALMMLPAYFSATDEAWWKVATWLRWPLWGVTGIGFLLYIEPGWNNLLQGYLNPESWLGKRVHNLQRYNRKEKWIVLGLSALRYAVFTFQFILALWVLGVDLSPDEAFLRIAAVYLGATLIPTFALAEIGLRESMALLILSPSSQADTAVFAATLLVWLINLMVPALVGAVLFVKSKPAE